MLTALLALILAVNSMALPPTSVIVAGPQAGADRFDFIPFGHNNACGSGKPALYLNGTDQYAVLYEVTNIGAGDSNLIYKLCVFKNGTQQDSANKPTIRNFDHPGVTNCLNCASGFDVVQVGTLLYIFYFTDGSDVADSLLSFKTFNMATDQWSAPNSSTLTTRTIAQAGDPYNFFSSQVPYFVVVYDPTTQYFYVIAQNGLRQNLAGTYFVRPCFARFIGGTSAWDTGWTNLGDSTTEIDMGAFSACLDCRGAVNMVIAAPDFAPNPNVNHFFFQSIYPDQTISALQDTGVSVNFTSAINESDSRILCTGTEFIVLYGSEPAGVNRAWTQLNCLRATVPTTNTLPSAWTSQIVRAAGDQLTAYIPFFINGELYAVEGLYSGGGGTLTASHYNGATWDNDITFAPAITLALADGTGSLGSDALITYDLTAPVTDPADAFGAFQRIYGLLGTSATTNYSAPVCPVLPTTTPGDGGRKKIALTPNQFDFCLHKEYRLFCNIDYDLKGCARLPKCFTVDEREWGGQA